MTDQAPGARATGHPIPPSAAWTSRRHSPIVGMLVAGLLAAACAGPDEDLASATRHTPAGPHPAPERASAAAGDRRDVDTAYRRFWTVAQQLDGHPEARWRTLLTEVAAEPVLTRILDGLHSRVHAGYQQFGTVTPRPRIAALTETQASVVDCQDASGSGEIDTTTGLATTVGRPRTPVAATLMRGNDGRWRVSEARYLPGDC